MYVEDLIEIGRFLADAATVGSHRRVAAIVVVGGDVGQLPEVDVLGRLPFRTRHSSFSLVDRLPAVKHHVRKRWASQLVRNYESVKKLGLKLKG
jgi:uncharacterized ParB-like nuclease family protein